MTEIDILLHLKSTYSNRSLNESDTRFKIIDCILKDVLKWPSEPIYTEVIVSGTRADYVLKGKNDKPVLIIESKKSGKYFELPNKSNSDKNYQKIILEQILTEKYVKDAIYQVRDYAEDLGCQYAAICNGSTWIFFKVSSSQKPWKKLPAFVIKSLDYFIEDFTEAINIFSYHNVVNNNSLSQNIGISKKVFHEIFYPKNSIIGYNTTVNSNKYAGPLATIANKYLGIIPENDRNFMNHCYVSNKGKYDNLQKDVQGFIHDSLTPYFKNIGFREFTDDKQGGAFGIRLSNLVQQQGLNNVLILFGGRGAGKSTFLKRLLFHIKPREIEMYSEVALIGLLSSSQTKEELTNEIWEKTLASIDKTKIRAGSREELLNLFEEEFEIYKKQILVGLKEESDDYQRLLRDFLLTHTKNTKLFCEKLSIKIKSKNKGLIVFIDNVDQLTEDLQDVCFLTAVEISERLSCIAIVSMREERYYQAKMRGVLDAYKNPGYHLSSPIIPEVIIKRINYILDQLKFTADVDLEYGIKNTSDLNVLNAFFEICKSQLKKNGSPLSSFLRYGTHGDVRMALNFFEGFITSGYTNISEMAAHADWYIQVHQVIKPMMIPDRFFYDEKKSKIPNLYQLRNDANSSHFTGLRILQFLHNSSGNSKSNGFVDAKYLIQIFDSTYGAKEDCIGHLILFLEKGLIEANNRLEIFSDEVDSVKITALGEYLFNYLAFNFAYIDLICVDCAIFDETLNNQLVRSSNMELRYYQDKDFMSRIKVRIERIDAFIAYLAKLEGQEFIDLALGSTEVRFTDKLRAELDKQKEIIMKSANNKKALENEYL
ncbi:AAA family ATPase [Mucilaginibacter sp. JRF]|uniref:AAA family ATPase n=1 Tax=Mucilaginibacter sp. JRF TaxID=2780088 RepID=UPI0018813124|nr:AAA family ATPase [Mucilaginibacter sp. JRF]MBE9584024.1 AAA family ATPase [Mucilaginibacter sp. JRF]